MIDEFQKKEMQLVNRQNKLHEYLNKSQESLIQPLLENQTSTDSIGYGSINQQASLEEREDLSQEEN